MICEASSSNPPAAVPIARARTGSGSPSSSSNNILSAAPGFRFQPTDEELVSYYLKRKVCGRPLVVDAIAEIDLYKWEPWDLPSLSRLRTRDMMWYFFSPLDRKYSSNRCRTNRATGQGYWKTTGKDRPVHHASRVVGMKKTLVFHAGRAPRGKRTNWVMHEYRLEDAQPLASESSSHPTTAAAAAVAIPQDSFVLCRIFQKRASGPQNGAQYGAPVIEEEWEETESMVIKTEGVSEVVLYAPHAAEQGYVLFDDSEKKQVLGFQHESTALVAADSERQDSGNQTDDMTISLEELLDLDADINVPGLLDDPNITINMGENSGMGEQPHSPSGQNDGYLELKDIFGNANVPTSNSFDGLLGVQNDHIIENDVNDGATLAGIGGTDFYFDTVNETASSQEQTQMCPPAEGVFTLQQDFVNPVAGNYPSGQLTEDNIVFYDTPTNDPPYASDILASTNDIQFPIPDLSGFDMMDDYLAYFDATDDLQYDTYDSSEKSEFVNTATMAQSNSVSEVPGTSKEMGAFSARFTDPTNQLENTNENKAAGPDMQVTEGWNKALKRRVVDMLGSISAPPAMAECSSKGKAVELLSTTRSSSSIHVSAGLIQVHGMSVMGSGAQHWSLQKNGEASFHVSYGMAANGIAAKSLCFEPSTKMLGGALGVLLRGGFYLVGLSALILAATFKVGICVFNK